MNQSSNLGMDRESEECLTQMAQKDEIFANRIEGVKFVLVVLSSKGMVYDLGAMRHKIVLTYPDSAIFFETPIGKSIGAAAPHKVDLLIDFTGPRQRQGLFSARKLRRRARFAVGRNSGLFRKRIYDRVYDEFMNDPNLPHEMLRRERYVQKKVLGLAGVSSLQAGETPPDRGKTIALELPGMQKF